MQIIGYVLLILIQGSAVPVSESIYIQTNARAVMRHLRENQ